MPRRIDKIVKEVEFKEVLNHFNIEIVNIEEKFIKFKHDDQENLFKIESCEVFNKEKKKTLGRFMLENFGKDRVLEFISQKGYDISPFNKENFFDLNIADSRIMSYKTYLSRDIITKTYDDSIKYGNCFLQADTGSGKTYGMVKNGPWNKKIIFLTPFKAQTEQCSKDYGGACITGIDEKRGFPPEHIAVHIKDNPYLIFCVYDKFLDLIDAMWINGWNLKEYILIIDEFHQFLWDCSDEFRGEAIDAILDNKQRFKSWIAITATPFGINGNYFKKVITTKNTSKKPKMKGALQVVELNTESPHSNELIERLTHHIKENHISRTQTLIMCESKKQAEKLSNGLGELGFKTDFVTSENKGESDIYSSIVKESKIPRKYDIVVFTPLIKSAVNIKSWKDKPIGNMHINLISHHKSNKYDIVSQFPARARDGFENLFIYNIGKEYFMKKYGHNLLPKLYDISSEIDVALTERYKVAKYLNSIKLGLKWEEFNDTYIHLSRTEGFKVRIHQIIRQKYTPILYDAIMYNDEAIHCIMRQHNYSNIKETISLKKLSSKTNTIQDMIDNLNENLVYTIRGFWKSLNTLELPKEFNILWEDIPLKFKVNNTSGGSYKRKRELLIDAIKEGAVDSQDLIELLTTKNNSKSKEIATAS